MKNNTVFVFNILFSSMKAYETDRDYCKGGVFHVFFSTKKGNNSHSVSQHSCTRRDFISFRDNNLNKGNMSLHACLFCLSACGILSTEHKWGHVLLLAPRGAGSPSGVSTESKVCCDRW